MVMINYGRKSIESGKMNSGAFLLLLKLGLREDKFESHPVSLETRFPRNEFEGHLASLEI